MAFLEQTSRFRAPVYAGDTLYPKLCVSECIEQNTTGVLVLTVTIHNQEGALVLDGEQRYLVKRKPAGSPTS